MASYKRFQFMCVESNLTVLNLGFMIGALYYVWFALNHFWWETLTLEDMKQRIYMKYKKKIYDFLET